MKQILLSVLVFFCLSSTQSYSQNRCDIASGNIYVSHSSSLNGGFTNAIPYQKYVKSVVTREFVVPSGSVSSATYSEIMKFAGIAIRTFALNRAKKRGNRYEICGTDVCQVTKITADGTDVSLSDVSQSAQDAVDETDGWYIAINATGSLAEIHFAAESSDIGPTNQISQNHKKFGLYGNGYVQSGDGDREQVPALGSPRGLFVTSLGYSDYAKSNPWDISQRDVARMAGGVEVDRFNQSTGRKILPVKFNGVQYCTMTYLQILAKYFGDRDYYLYRCGSTPIRLRDVSVDCSSSSVNTELVPPNPKYLEWVDRFYVDTIKNMTRVVTGKLRGGTSEITEYGNGVSSVLKSGPERIYMFTPKATGTLTITFKDLDPNLDLDMYLCDHAGPNWGAFDKAGFVSAKPNESKTLNVSVLSGKECYIFIDCNTILGTNDNGSYQITFSGSAVTNTGTNKTQVDYPAGYLYDAHEYDRARNTLQGTTKEHITNNSIADAAQCWAFEYLGFDSPQSAGITAAVQPTVDPRKPDIDVYQFNATWSGSYRFTIKPTPGKKIQFSITTVSGSNTIAEQSFRETTSDVSFNSSIRGANNTLTRLGALINTFLTIKGDVANYQLFVEWTPTGSFLCTDSYEPIGSTRNDTKETASYVAPNPLTPISACIGVNDKDFYKVEALSSVGGILIATVNAGFAGKISFYDSNKKPIAGGGNFAAGTPKEFSVKFGRFPKATGVSSPCYCRYIGIEPVGNVTGDYTVGISQTDANGLAVTSGFTGGITIVSSVTERPSNRPELLLPVSISGESNICPEQSYTYTAVGGVGPFHWYAVSKQLPDEGIAQDLGYGYSKTGRFTDASVSLLVYDEAPSAVCETATKEVAFTVHCTGNPYDEPSTAAQYPMGPICAEYHLSTDNATNTSYYSNYACGPKSMKNDVWARYDVSPTEFAIYRFTVIAPTGIGVRMIPYLANNADGSDLVVQNSCLPGSASDVRFDLSRGYRYLFLQVSTDTLSDVKVCVVDVTTSYSPDPRPITCPYMVKNVVSSTYGTDGLYVTCDPIEGATQYQWYFINADNANTLTKFTNTNSVSATGFSGLSYFIGVKAQIGGVWTPYYAYGAGAVARTISCASARNVTLTRSGSSITVSWTRSPSNESGYYVRLFSENDGEGYDYDIVLSGTSSSYTFTNVPSDNWYRAFVQTKCGTSTWAPLSVSPRLYSGTLCSNSGFTFTTYLLTPTYVSIDYTDRPLSLFSSNYQTDVRWSKRSSGFWDNTGSITGFSRFVLKDLTPGTTYNIEFRVRCECDNTSDWRSYTFTTPAVIPNLKFELVSADRYQSLVPGQQTNVKLRITNSGNQRSDGGVLNAGWSQYQTNFSGVSELTILEGLEVLSIPSLSPGEVYEESVLATVPSNTSLTYYVGKVIPMGSDGIATDNSKFQSVTYRGSDLCTGSITATISTPVNACKTEGTINFLTLTGNITPPFSIIWSNGTVSPSRTVSFNSTYTATVIDQNGCSGQFDILYDRLVSARPLLSIYERVTCNSHELTAGLNSQQLPISYQWSNGRNGAAIVVKEPGRYSVTATDVNGCQTVKDFDIESIDSIALSINQSRTAIEATGGF